MLDPEGMFLALFHLIGVVVAVGGLVFLVFIFLPVADDDFSKKERHRMVAKAIKRFHPLLLLCYGLLILTGAWMITRYKIDAGVNYFSEYGRPLIFKLTLVFLSILLSCYQFFGLGLPILYAVEEAYDSFDKKALESKITQMRWVALANIVLLIFIIYLGLVITRI
jgi:putative copper export protein